MAATSADGQHALMVLAAESSAIASEKKPPASTLARVLGHNQVANGAGNVELEAIIARKLGHS